MLQPVPRRVAALLGRVCSAPGYQTGVQEGVIWLPKPLLLVAETFAPPALVASTLVPVLQAALRQLFRPVTRGRPLQASVAGVSLSLLTLPFGAPLAEANKQSTERVASSRDRV